MSAEAVGTLLAALSGLMNLLGGYLSARMGERSREGLRLLIAVSAGFLLAAVFLDLLPEAARGGNLAWAFAGYLVLYVSEHLFDVHAHEGAGLPATGAAPGRGADHPPDELLHEHTLLAPARQEEHTISRAGGIAAAAGLTVHAFFDGVAVVASFAGGVATGLLMFVALSAHKLPAGFALGSVMQAADAGEAGRRAAIWSTLGLAVATLAGGVTVWLAGSLQPRLVDSVIALAAGAILYLGATEMIPVAHQHGTQRALAGSLGGALLFYLGFTLVRSFGLG
ncbi:MAG: ZIP family metal transporter [Bacillota bacterium]|nr:ZIP family metal transporter [Bacillota bacterium]